MKFCPLIKAECRSDCAWYYEFDDDTDTDCAIKIIAEINVFTANAYADEKELQENLYKDNKKELPN